MEEENKKNNGYDYAMLCYAEGATWRKGKRATSGIPQKVVRIHSKIKHVAWRDKGSKKIDGRREQKEQWL